MPKDYSYGIIPVRLGENGSYSILLVGKNNGQNGEFWWGFPKGHAEGGEKPIDTAKRETKEEVGLFLTNIDETKTFSDHYITKLKDGRTAEKTVTYFIGLAGDEEVKIDPKEIDNYIWSPDHLVEKMLSRESTKNMFCLAKPAIEEFIKNLAKN